MLPARIACVDIETTGTGPDHDRIIEIGIVMVEDGKVVEEFTSLVDPQTTLAPEITFMTGISAGDLESAPTFRGISDKILPYLEGSVFAAHNARFDYTFIKKEFARIGIRWAAPQLCTVKLSRTLFPQHSHHTLDDLITNHDLSCTHRHRALPDAQVVQLFLDYVVKTVDPVVVDFALSHQSKSPNVPSHLKRDWPTDPGVYIFYAEDGAILYIGKSINIKDRILQHFSSDHELPLTKAIHSIETRVTEGEFSALLLESQLIKQLKPLHNRRLRSKETNHYILKSTTPEGYMTVTRSSSFDDPTTIAAICKSAAAARKTLTQATRDHKLCGKLLGLETNDGPCYAAQFGKCQACTGREPAFAYNVRFLEAFGGSMVKPWPFDGPILIPDGNTGLLFNNWICYGVADSANRADISDLAGFNWDTYKILFRHLAKHPKSAKLYNQGSEH